MLCLSPSLADIPMGAKMMAWPSTSSLFTDCNTTEVVNMNPLDANDVMPLGPGAKAVTLPFPEAPEVRGVEDVAIPFHLITILSVMTCAGCYLTAETVIRRIGQLITKGDVYGSLPLSTRTAWCSRFASTLPCLTICFLALYSLCYDNIIKSREELLWGHSKVSATACAILMGFMIQETCIHVIHYEYKEFRWPSIIAHHVLIIMASEYMLTNNIGQYLAMWRMLAEFSTPFVNIRVCLIEIGKKDSPLYSAVGVLILILFFMFRVGTMPYFYYLLYYASGAKGYYTVRWVFYSLTGICLYLDVMNIRWFSIIARLAVGHFKGGDDHKDKKHSNY